MEANSGEDGAIKMIRSNPDPNGLNSLVADAGLKALSQEQRNRFNDYLELILKWNARINLTSIRDRDGILNRHFIECIASAQLLPAGLESLLDLGSGAGFPGIPISIWRPEIPVTLAESQNKKAAFLNEVVRSLSLNARVFAGRAETIRDCFDCVTLRAVDRMEKALATGISLLHPGGVLMVLTTLVLESNVRAALSAFSLNQAHLPGSTQRLVLWGISNKGTHVPRGTKASL